MCCKNNLCYMWPWFGQGHKMMILTMMISIIVSRNKYDDDDEYIMNKWKQVATAVVGG